MLNNIYINFHQKGCEYGSYGEGCKQRCGKNCVNNICNLVTGHCEGGCISGWTGHLCDQGFLIVYPIREFILPLIEILKFDWLRQIQYAAIFCFPTNRIFLICPFHVTCWPHITFSSLFSRDLTRNFTLCRHTAPNHNVNIMDSGYVHCRVKKPCLCLYYMYIDILSGKIIGRTPTIYVLPL